MKKARAKAPKPEPCPKCGSENVVPIQYGFPSVKMFEAADRREIALGGCCVEPGIPLRACVDCGEEFGRLGIDEGYDAMTIDGLAAVFPAEEARNPQSNRE